jgi:hypothetical protein
MLLLTTLAMMPCSIKGIEARENGLLLTFTFPIGATSCTDATHWSVSGHAVSEAMQSPDGYRLFLRTVGQPKGDLEVSGRCLTSGEMRASVKVDTPSSRPGPDFAASAFALQPSLSRTPPPGALRLFFNGDTSNLVMKNNPAGPFTWTVDGDALVVQQGQGDVLSRMPLGSGRYHIEWLSPSGGAAGSQQNGNSGVKFASRYEVQIMNNAGAPWPSRHNEAGSIYRIKAADTNASTGPDRWQTYDVLFTAPNWHKGRKLTDARMTVWWNGVKVHDDVLVNAKTGASIGEGPEPMPLLLQDHASTADGEVRFRNVWFVANSKAPVVPDTTADQQGP